MTELEKRIYNTHLAVSRSLRNKPFKLKENFDGFEESSKYPAIKKLSIFFTKYPDVHMDMYFSAPYKLYNDVEYFDHNYFASPRAIKAYTVYKQQLLLQSPDSQIEDIKKSITFITRFCLENKIQLHDYPDYRGNRLEPIWMYHIKENKINPYSLMEFSNIFHYINEMPFDEREILLGSFGKNFLTYKTKYQNTKLLKQFLSTAVIKLKLFIDKSLNSTKSCV